MGAIAEAAVHIIETLKIPGLLQSKLKGPFSDKVYASIACAIRLVQNAIPKCGGSIYVVCGTFLKSGAFE